jgi:hypothetical protein
MVDWTSPAELARDACRERFASCLPYIPHSVLFSGIRQVQPCATRCIRVSRIPSLQWLTASEWRIAGNWLLPLILIGNSSPDENDSIGLWCAICLFQALLCSTLSRHFISLADTLCCFQSSECMPFFRFPQTMLRTVEPSIVGLDVKR